MRKTKASAICLIFGLLCNSTGFAEAEWKAEIGWGDQFFPSFIIATAGVNLEKSTLGKGAKSDPRILGDPLGLIRLAVLNPHEKSKIKIEVSGSRFIAKSTYEGVLENANQGYLISPLIQYNFDELYKVYEPVPENVNLTLYLNDQPVGTLAKRVLIRSINDCPLEFMDGKKKTDVSWMIAAYVNENDPLVDRILKEALESRIVPNFKAYQGTTDEVVAEIFAIWNVFQRNGIQYSSVTTASAESDRVFSQWIRFPGDSFKNSQANCVDGSVLFASIFRKIGLDSYLVLLPGHCIVGVFLDPEHKSHLFLDTTVLGKIDTKNHYWDDKKPLSVLMSQLTGRQTKNQASYDAFQEAVIAGEQEFDKAMLDKTKSGSESQFPKLLGIKKARDAGILPLKSRELTAN